jgi:signal transduction histidine kinase
MQRRITLALVGTALAAILLVGAGVLGFASIGAERDARERVELQLDAVADLVVAQAGRSADLGPIIGRLGDAFDNSTIEVAVLGPQGNMRPPRRDRTPADLGPALTSDDLASVRAGEPLFTRIGGDLRGVQRVEVSDQITQADVVVVVRTRVATIANQARLWFVLSAGIVLVGATVLAAALARRFVQPIRRATAATAAIASGDLGVRVPVDGTDEIADLGSGINTMAAELERGRRAEQQFLLSVSHDLRTPLTALRGYGEALEDGTATDTTRVGSIITHHANRLGRLVGDLLDLGKLEARQFRFDIRTIDATAAVSAAALGAEPLAEDRGVRIEMAEVGPAMVAVDPDRLGQITANLIENAIAFASSLVLVSVESNGLETIITVTDDGPGIEPADLPHVFERLYVTKLVPERSETPSGLGLAIVRELTHAMGGTVEATLPEAGGTAMIVRFPAAARPSDPMHG